MKPLTASELKILKDKKRHALTVKEIDALRPAPKGQRYEIMDAAVKGLAVRVTDKGKRTFVLIGRFPGGKHPTRREIDEVGKITLEEAHEKARCWHALIKQGIDPTVEEKRLAEERVKAEIRARRHTLASVVEEYLKRHIAKHRTAKSATRIFRKEIIPVLGHRPIAEVTREEVKDLLRAIADRPALYMAMRTYQHISALYAWADNEEIYGIEAAPTGRIKPKLFFGKRNPRTRALSDPELRAFWHGCERLGYPWGHLFQMLLLTGCRLNEVAAASWREISPDGTLLTVPAARFKSEVEHLVPLSSESQAILNELSHFTGNFIFTTTGGQKPVGNYGRAKKRLNRMMADELGHTPERFVIHDLRRTCRTRLSSLRVPHEVAEMVVGHAKAGLDRVYNQHTYEPEIREALERWAVRLRSIVTPPPENVASFEDHVAA